MTAFHEAWTLLKELSPSAQIMQDNAREALENRGSGYFQPNRFVQPARPSVGPQPAQPAQPAQPNRLPLPPPKNRSQQQTLNRFYNNTQPLDPSTMEYEREFDRVHGDIE